MRDLVLALAGNGLLLVLVWRVVLARRTIAVDAFAASCAKLLLSDRMERLRSLCLAAPRSPLAALFLQLCEARPAPPDQAQGYRELPPEREDATLFYLRTLETSLGSVPGALRRPMWLGLLGVLLCGLGVALGLSAHPQMVDLPRVPVVMTGIVGVVAWVDGMSSVQQQLADARRAVARHLLTALVKRLES